MAVLCADLTPGLEALRPDDHERIRDAAAIGFALPAPERRVPGMRPAPGVVIEVLRATEVVDRREVLREVVGYVVEELALVHRAVGATLGAGPVVGDDQDQRVLVF